MVDSPAGRVTLGASMANGIEQKGIDSLQQCIKKCAIAGGGVQATVSMKFSPLDGELYVVRCILMLAVKFVITLKGYYFSLF